MDRTGSAGGGFIFAGFQPIHPPDFPSSVTTEVWAVIIALKLAMCFMFLAGIAGIHVRQMDKAGWLGLAGFALFSLSWVLQPGFVFAQVFILPLLATALPMFVGSFPGIVNGSPGDLDIDASFLPIRWWDYFTLTAAYCSASQPSAPKSCQVRPRFCSPSRPC